MYYCYKHHISEIFYLNPVQITAIQAAEKHISCISKTLHALYSYSFSRGKDSVINVKEDSNRLIHTSLSFLSAFTCDFLMIFGHHL